MTEIETDLPAFPPTRGCPFAPPQLYADARDEGGAVRVEMSWLKADVALVSRYQDVKTVLGSDSASVDYRRPDFPVMVPHRRYVAGNDPVAFIQLDPPRHTELRRLVTPALTVKRVREMRPQIQALVDAFIRELTEVGSPADLMVDFAYKIPGAVTCALFGVPQEDSPRLELLTRKMLYANDDGEVDMGAFAEFVDYLAVHLRDQPDAAPIVQRLNEARERGDVDYDEMVRTALVIFSGGFETTASAIGAAVFELLRRPEDLAFFRDADDEQAAVAVDEILRYTSIAHLGLGRTTTDDIELADGTVLRKGDRVVVSLLSANRDEREFDHPDALVLDRVDNEHVAFGFGPHQCPGQQIARLEILVAVRSLLRALPGLQLAVDAESVVFRDKHEIRGPIVLPVRW